MRRETKKRLSAKVLKAITTHGLVVRRVRPGRPPFGPILTSKGDLTKNGKDGA